MKNEILDKNAIQARIQIIKLLKAAIAEAHSLNEQLDNIHGLLQGATESKKVA